MTTQQMETIKEQIMEVTQDELQAFPCVITMNGTSFFLKGMSLRDWFAANATEQDIQDYLPQDRREEFNFKKEHGFYPDRRWARYRHADAMLAERIKP